MEIKSLQKDVISSIKSAIHINSISQCALELVLNSLDAKSTAIAVRINMVNFRIQVVDNGSGITRENLELLGTQYATNKCHNLKDLRKKSNYYGYRGESLWSIFNVSKTVNITSREKSANVTFNKHIHKKKAAKIERVKDRPSCGTTITVENLFHNVPVRQKGLKENKEFAEIKRLLEAIIVLRPDVSFTLRNDVNSELLLGCEKKDNIKQSLRGLFPDIDEGKLQLLKVSKSSKIQIDALLYETLYRSSSAQFVYVNKRPVSFPKVQKTLNKLFVKYAQKNSAQNEVAAIFNKNKHPVYVVNIKCPYSGVDFLPRNGVLFKNIAIVKNCIEKLALHFFKIEKPEVSKESKKKRADLPCKSNCGVSEIFGVIKAHGYKRKRSASGKSSIDDFQTQRSRQFEQKKPVESKNDAKIEGSFEENCPNLEVINTTNCKSNPTSILKAESGSLTNSETNGKAIIMDIFLKSTKIYNNHDPDLYGDGETQAKSEFTFSVLTSKKRRGEKLNLVVSPKAHQLEKNHNTTSKCVQTTMIFNDYNSKTLFNNVHETSKELVGNLFDFESNFQAPLPLSHNFTNDKLFGGNDCFPVENVFSFEAPRRKSMQRYVSDYNYDFSNLKEAAPFGFVSNKNIGFNDCQMPTRLFDCNKNFQQQQACYCFWCSQQNNKNNYCNLTTLENVQLSPILKDPRKSPPREKSALLPRFQAIVMTPQINRTKRNGSTFFTHEDTKCSKFFKKNFKTVNDTFAINKKITTDNTDFFSLNESSRDKTNRINDIIDLISRCSDKKNETIPPTVASSNLLVTLGDKQKTALIEKHLKTETALNKLALTPTQTQKDVRVVSQCMFNDWMKSVDNFGNVFYYNKRTGISTFKSPKRGENFQMCQRFEFVPKGMSPILTTMKPVDRSLNLEVKEQLQKAIIESYENQLVTVKWEHYLKNNSSADFFKEMYEEKAKELGVADVPCVANKSSVTLDKRLFESIRVIGQVDRKFIAVLDEKSRHLLVFDQHAVHERVRVEQLQQGYKDTFKKLKCAVTIFLPQTDLEHLVLCKTYLNNLGIFFTTMTNCIVITDIPTCLHNKIIKDKKHQNEVYDLVELLITDCLEIIKSTRGAPVSCPNVLKNLINFEACRGAIKFGDALSFEECTNLLNSLNNCVLPFQCAHGRPTVVPLVKLDQLPDIRN